MNKFRKVAIITIACEILICILLNVLWVSLISSRVGAEYRVEASRIALRLENETIDDIDVSEYSYIKRVSVFDAEEVCNNDYLVKSVNGTLYRIEYEAENHSHTQLFINLAFLLVILLSIGMFIYIGAKVIKPFSSMNSLTEELASGTLATPVKAEKSKFFGKFLWGVNMLREKLESTRVREIELQRDRKTLILSLSHDIKTPLSAIELYDKALAKNLYDTPEKKQEALDAILANSEEIRRYVSEITIAAKEDFLDFDVNMGEIYFSSVMNKIKTYYTERLSVIHTQFIVEPYTDCLICADRDRLVEILQNIMENAIKYGDGVEIKISVDEEEGCRIIYVENSGCSIKQEELTNIFDSFYRGPNAQKKKGNGLGLYICKQLARKMDGDVFAEIRKDRFCVGVVIRKA